MVIRAAIVLSLSPVVLFAQNAKPVATVTPMLAEFSIPLEQPANATWNWNREETADNEGEYTWQIAVPNADGRYTFGFYLYKLPGSKMARGDLSTLLKAGQASVFKEDAQGRGTLVRNAVVNVTPENNRIVLRMTDPALIHLIFGARPATATINTRAIRANFEVVTIDYR